MTKSPDRDGGVTVINGLVNAGEVYHPNFVLTTWFKTWALACGKCGKDFARFTLFGKPKCPYCGQRNHLNFTTYY